MPSSSGAKPSTLHSVATHSGAQSTPLAKIRIQTSPDYASAWSRGSTLMPWAVPVSVLWACPVSV